MAGTQHGNTVGVLLHPVECGLSCNLHARSRGTRMFLGRIPLVARVLIRLYQIGTILAIL